MGQGRVAIGRARDDLAAGRPWKARERLRSYLTAYPTDLEALDLLGEVHYEMRDLPAAGAVWTLSLRDDHRSRQAVTALHEEHPRARALLGALNVRAPLEAWPPEVQERLRALQADAAARGVSWAPGGVHAEQAPKWAVGETLALGGCLLALLVLIACTAIGLVVAVGWLVGVA